MDTGESFVPKAMQEEQHIAVATLLDDFLEKEGIVAALRQRIVTLEQFRNQCITSPLQPTPTDTHTTQQLQAELQQIEATFQATIDEQAGTILKLERQIQELNGCQSVLESELDRLTGENEALKTQTAEKIEIVQDAEAPAAENTAGSDDSALIAELQEEVSQAMDMAFGAMRSNADLGGIIHLLTTSFKCSTTTELGKLVIDTIRNYNLQGVVSFPHGGKREFFSTTKVTSKEDQQRIEKMETTELLTETDQHLMLYTDYCQLLIWDIEKDDFKAFNDLKDTLRMLATGVNAGSRRVISEISATKERANLERLVMTTQKNIQNIEAKQRKETTLVNNMATEAIGSLKEQLTSIPGDQDKKNALVTSMTQELVKIEKVVTEVALVDESFKKVIGALTASLSKQKTTS